MQRHFISILILLGSLMTTFAKDNETAQYKINVQDFESIEIIDGVPVEYFCRPDSAGWAIFTCAPEMASHIMFSNNNNHLTIRTDCDEKPFVGVPTVRVYSTTLKKAINSGDSITCLHLDAVVPLKDFKVRQIGNGTTEVYALNSETLEAGVTAGNGTLVLDGKTRKAKISNVGSGPVNARDLEASTISCMMFGSGNIECSPIDHLRIYGAGTGKVIYHGSPKITMRGIGVKAVPHTTDLAYTLFRNMMR